MGVHDLLGDGQPQAAAVDGPAARGVRTVEAGEDLGQLVAGDPRPGVGDGDPGLGAVLPRVQPYAAPGGVLHRVVDEVGDHLPEPFPVGVDHRGGTGDLQREAFRVGQRAELVGRGLRDVTQVDRADEQVQAALVGAGEREQVVHHPGHPPDLFGGAGEHLHRVRRQVSGGQRHVQLGAHHGQRGTQVVGGIGDQAPLRVDAGFEAVEHRVECLRQPADLVGDLRHGYPLVEPVHADPPRPVGDRRDRPQRQAGHPPSGRPGDQQRDRPAGEQDDQQPVYGGIGPGERGGQDQYARLPAIGDRPREEAERRRGRTERGGDHQRMPGQYPGELREGDHRLAGDAIVRAVHDRSGAGQQLGAGVATGQPGQRRVGHLGELAGTPVGTETGGDLCRAAGQRLVDVAGEVGTQPLHQVRAEQRQYDHQDRRVPGGQPYPDRQPPHSAHPVPDAARGADQRLVERPLQLAPQVPDVHVHSATAPPAGPPGSRYGWRGPARRRRRAAGPAAPGRPGAAARAAGPAAPRRRTA
ncbi:MAG: hypothetical protein AUI14_06750 [Actinobacteria bacterium 13_2_20CM_2_71_6]|nr:MAG: hypothetical protein AUI14_06750 [Actinobacteria bacterium 13_2_20CM_2_71_6]